MKAEHQEMLVCPACQQLRPAREIVPTSVLNDDACAVLRQQGAGDSAICTTCLTALAGQRVATADDPAAPPPQRSALHDELHHRQTTGERIADAVAAFVGSWTFLVAQGIFLAIWITFNLLAIYRYRFDPYPFIFLNLVLSWAAALQAPLVLMSQNRQNTRDRLRDEHEYLTNVAAEEEIRALHRKLDAINGLNWSELLAVQQEQLTLLQQLHERHAEG